MKKRNLQFETIGINAVSIDLAFAMRKEFHESDCEMEVHLIEREIPEFGQPAELLIRFFGRDIAGEAITSSESKKPEVAILSTDVPFVDSLCGRRMSWFFKALTEAYVLLDGYRGTNAVINFESGRISANTEEAVVEVCLYNHGESATLEIPTTVTGGEDFVISAPVRYNIVSPIALALSNPELANAIDLLNPDCDLDAVFVSLAAQITQNIRDSNSVSKALAEEFSCALSELYCEDITVMPNGVIAVDEVVIGKNCMHCIEQSVRSFYDGNEDGFDVDLISTYIAFRDQPMQANAR